jgi:hypothetical protein
VKKKCQRKRIIKKKRKKKEKKGGSERENAIELYMFMEYALLSFWPFEFKEKQ